MKCPLDGNTLLLSNRNNIEIDYCPECRGVWLDRGELDKILAQAEPPIREERPSHISPSRDTRDHDQHYRKPHKKENFLTELFDF